MNGNFYIVLGDCITTSAYESNTKAILSSYIRKCITFGWLTRAYRRASGVFPFFSFTSSPNEDKILTIKKLRVKVKGKFCSPGEG